jgi:DNA-directed RNA polymerase sigma subunit (sigma70/sigma32)
VNVAQNNLYDSLGRDPTVDELADELKWTPKKVSAFQQSYGRKEFVESEGDFLDKDTEDSTLTDFYYHGLAPDDKKLFEDITGYGGVRPKTNAQLRSKHNLTQGQLSYKKRKFVNDIKGIQQGRY